MIDFNISNYLRISLTDVVLVLISTSIIILIAKKFFWDKLLAYFQHRQDIIQGNIDASAKLKEEAQATKDEYDEKMKNAGKEAHSIIESAKAKGEQERETIVQNAQNQADHIMKKAQEEIERDKRNAEKEMRAAISDVAMEAAKALVKKEMDDETQKQFVDDFIQQAGDKEW